MGSGEGARLHHPEKYWGKVLQEGKEMMEKCDLHCLCWENCLYWGTPGEVPILTKCQQWKSVNIRKSAFTGRSAHVRRSIFYRRSTQIGKKPKRRRKGNKWGSESGAEASMGTRYMTRSQLAMGGGEGGRDDRWARQRSEPRVSLSHE